MSRNIIFVLMYHCHKLLDLIYVNRHNEVGKNAIGRKKCSRLGTKN
jgi:hypothetical protein